MASTNRAQFTSSFRVRFWGFVIVAAGPAAMAIAMWRELQVELATARANGEECCGLAALTPLVLFFVVAPVCGLFGALFAPVTAWLAAACWSEFLNDAKEP